MILNLQPQRQIPTFISSIIGRCPLFNPTCQLLHPTCASHSFPLLPFKFPCPTIPSLNSPNSFSQISHPSTATHRVVRNGTIHPSEAREIKRSGETWECNAIS